jgi:hypothetical protein
MKFIYCCLLLFCCLHISCNDQKGAGADAIAGTAAGKANGIADDALTADSSIERFETGIKGSYAEGVVSLASGTWNFTDAMLGNLDGDKKNGRQSVRIKGKGKIAMQFNYAGGASTVSVLHARYAADAPGNWQLWYSTNGGTSYQQAGTTITSNNQVLSAASFTLNINGSIRFEIRKTDGGNNRINFDDFIIAGTHTGGSPVTAGHKKFLFDATKAETAGNADWVIDEDNNMPQPIPTPLQAGVTATTAENFWTGAISGWGIALAKQGHTVATLPASGSITYGNAANAQDLSKYDVFVVDEPNIRFTNTEKNAILQFIKNGGGLCMISDHTLSDRNNDGWDSPAIWNDLMMENEVATNPFGFSINLTNIVELSNNVLTGHIDNAILHGSQGNVTQLDFHNGATMSINSTGNPAVQGLIWRKGMVQNNNNLLCLSSVYGKGRVFAVTDSSPMDDGTGAPGNKLYNGWTTYSHIPLFLNASLWLAKLQ